jgi:pimeloyl-ACP methyl ester carboxylesterase
MKRFLLLALVLVTGRGFATAAPEPPVFGKPGDPIFAVTIPLQHPKKSEDRAQGGPNHVFFTAWLPPGVARVRALYHTPLNLDTVEKEHSRAMAAHWGFALIGGNLMRVRHDELATVLLAGLRELASKSGHPELAEAPFVLSGMSAGAGLAAALAEALPERALAAGLVCLEVGPQTARVKDVPMLTIFGEKDGRQMEQLAAKLPQQRAAFDACWAIAPQWTRKHEWAKANHLLWSFLDSVLRQRLKPDGQLRPGDPARAWLGDPASWTNRTARIAPAAQFAGDRAAACWFPDEDTARVWQAFVVPQPLLRITTPEAQGDGKPLAMFASGAEVTVQVECAATLSVTSLKLYDRATRLSEARVTDRRSTFRVTGLAPGFHTFIAQADLGGGRVELSRPVSVLVRVSNAP